MNTTMNTGAASLSDEQIFDAAHEACECRTAAGGFIFANAAQLRAFGEVLARQPAAIDKEDERGAFEAWAKKQGRRFNEGDLQNAKSWALAAWMARAAAQQDEPSTGICFFCGELMNGEHESDCPQAARAASTSANVAQGAEAVTLTAERVINESRNHFGIYPADDTNRLAFEARMQALAAPPAQAALNDDARDAARWRWFTQNYGALNLHEKFAGNTPRVFTHGLKGRSWGEITRTIDAALTAAQSASGDTK